MLVRFGADGLRPEWPSCVVCIGTFDGVHLGHQAVIGQAVESARKFSLPAVVVTFDRHPLAVLAPERNPPDVGTPGLNLEQFARLRVTATLLLRFDRILAETTAADFFQSVLVEGLRASRVVIGHDFAFGKGREGSPDWLRERMETDVVPPFALEGERVSSSRIRAAVQDGDIATARTLLGRPWEQEGVVIAGQQLGRTLGFPTLNLARLGNQIVPADGVYAGRAKTPGGEYRAAIGIGVRPGIGDGSRTIEAYLIDYPGESLYGAPVRLSYLRRLREERAFDSLEDLKGQMARDVAEASVAE